MTIMSKAEIDTRAPFRSVKEAVTLFGERVLASEVYTNKLKEMQEGSSELLNHEAVTNELDETKQSLQKAREESTNLALYLSSLQQELEQTKRELQIIKTRESSRRVLFDLEIEDLKFVEDSTESTEQVKKETTSYSSHGQRLDFQKKKYVTFGNPQSMAQVIVPPAPPPPPIQNVFQRHPKNKKPKPLLTLIARIFSKKRGNSEVYMA